MNEAEQQVLDRLRALLAAKLPLYRLILFGSRARGDADYYSDLDVVVILDGPLDEAAREVISDCAWEAGFAQGVVVVPVAFSRQEWENGPERHSLLAQAVAAEGIAW
jgi:DNA polymerase sigma